MKALILWLAGFFQDQSNSASSKRATLYVCLWFMYLQVNAGIDGRLKDTEMNYYLLWANVLLICFCVGAITSETFAKLLEDKKQAKTTEHIKTEEITKEKIA